MSDITLKNIGWWAILASILYVLLISETIAQNTTSSQRGAQQFSIYCHSCHTLRYAGLPEVNMLPIEAEHWFGKAPPDLSNIARIRGSIWLKQFLMGFYDDPHQPFGRNNSQFLNVSMPDVLATISQEACREQVVEEIITYLNSIADPSRTIRQKIGWGVLMFLSCFTVCWLILCKFSNKK